MAQIIISATTIPEPSDLNYLFSVSGEMPITKGSPAGDLQKILSEIGIRNRTSQLFIEAIRGCLAPQALEDFNNKNEPEYFKGLEEQIANGGARTSTVIRSIMADLIANPQQYKGLATLRSHISREFSWRIRYGYPSEIRFPKASF